MGPQVLDTTHELCVMQGQLYLWKSIDFSASKDISQRNCLLTVQCGMQSYTFDRIEQVVNIERALQDCKMYFLAE